MKIEIWSDIVCPFCYIGKRHFETALKESGRAAECEVVYRSFELDPAAPKSQTRPIVEILAEKYGRPVEWARQANQQVARMGEAAGILFAMEKIIPSNSFDAHRLIALAAAEGKQREAVEACFESYFLEGRDIALAETLQAILKKVGLDGESSWERLTQGAFAEQVREDEAEAQRLGIQGVPFFVFDRKTALSGAQPVESFLQALRQH